MRFSYGTDVVAPIWFMPESKRAGRKIVLTLDGPAVSGVWTEIVAKVNRTSLIRTPQKPDLRIIG